MGSLLHLEIVSDRHDTSQHDTRATYNALQGVIRTRHQRMNDVNRLRETMHTFLQSAHIAGALHTSPLLVWAIAVLLAGSRVGLCRVGPLR